MKKLIPKIQAIKSRILCRNPSRLTGEELIDYIYTVTKKITWSHWKTCVSADNTDVKGILRCALKYPAPVFLEIGAWMGRTTCALGVVAKRKQGMVVAIDNFTGDPKHKKQFEWVGKAFEDGFFDVFWKNVIKFGLEDTVHPIKKFSDDAVDDLKEILNGKKCDLIFIDGDHTHEGVCSDINNYLPFLADGGTMIFDDFCNIEVRAAAGDFFKKRDFNHYTTNRGKVGFYQRACK